MSKLKGVRIVQAKDDLYDTNLELQELNERILNEERRLQDIADLLQELETRKREKELQRLADQASEWLRDYIPSGAAEFGTMPVFRPDSMLDPEVARSRAGSRKASRKTSRFQPDNQTVSVEEIGSILGYDDAIFSGYGSRSRQQSVERNHK